VDIRRAHLRHNLQVPGSFGRIRIQQINFDSDQSICVKVKIKEKNLKKNKENFFYASNERQTLEIFPVKILALGFLFESEKIVGSKSVKKPLGFTSTGTSQGGANIPISLRETWAKESGKPIPFTK
jgi:hypothetical protein